MNIKYSQIYNYLFFLCFIKHSIKYASRNSQKSLPETKDCFLKRNMHSNSR